MSGIYIHIPFCKKACHYCDFHFSTTLKKKGELINAICAEIALRKDYLGNEKIATLYFGGGTPSLLNFEELQRIVTAIREYFIIDPAAEITFETNPDDLSISKLEELKKLGINRLSIGIQSFFDEDLKLMNRSHTSNQAVNAVKEAKKLRFENISIDLIYGLPNLTLEKWGQNLEKAFELDVPHLSAYSLTVEERTALHRMVKDAAVTLPAEAAVIEQFNFLTEKTKENGYIHYEISNFGKEGMFSQHNTSYWKNEKYLGIGPSAHSYNHTSRQWNIKNNALYIKNILEDTPWYEVETLSEEDKFNEYIMTRLRTIWGIDLFFVKWAFGAERMNILMKEAEEYISSGLIRREKESIILTEKGKLLADKIASDLFI